MPNHIHLLWKMADGYKREEVQGALFSFTGHAFKKLLKQKTGELNLYKVSDADREFPRLTGRAGILGKKSNDQRMFLAGFLFTKAGLYSLQPVSTQVGSGQSS